MSHQWFHFLYSFLCAQQLNQDQTWISPGQDQDQEQTQTWNRLGSVSDRTWTWIQNLAQF